MELEASQVECILPGAEMAGGQAVSLSMGGAPMRFRRSWLAVAPFVFLLAILYFHVFLKLLRDWYTLPDFSHGFLVPVFAGLLLWERRASLRTLPLQPARAGILWVVAALCTLLAGFYGAELFLSRLSFVLLLAGLILTFCGWRILREAGLALAVLLLAIPVPAIVFNQITFPLQILASELASDILPLFGVPILRAGNVIQLPAMQLEVAEACSGIRSLMALFTLAVFYGHFVEPKGWRRVFLALSSIPIAVAANAFRIVGTGLCVQFWDPDKALGFFHEFSGWVVFVISFGSLYLVHLGMGLVSRWKRVPA
jgi:exosortase